MEINQWIRFFVDLHAIEQTRPKFDFHTGVLGVAFCLSVVPDFRPLWREHAPTSNERIHLPTLVAAGGAAFVVIAALALAATDPKAEDVVLDMFAGV